MKRIAFAAFLAMSTPLHAEPVTIAATMGVDALVSNIRNSMSTLISQLETSGKVVGFSYAVDLNVILQNIETVGKALSGKVFGDLNESQKAIFQNAMIAIDDVDRKAARQVESLERLSASIGMEISRLPMTDKSPLLTKYSPSYVLNKDDSYTIRLNGSRLHGDASSLYFGATPCTLVSSIDTELRYSCPATAFSGETSQWHTGLLTLTENKPWYRFWAGAQSTSYKVGLMVIPNKLGTFKLKSTELITGSENIPRTLTNGHANAHCVGPHSVVWTYRPQDNCRIDITTVKHVPSLSSQSRYYGVQNLASTGFQITGLVVNNGKCIWPAKDGRGNLNVTASWIDVCPTLKEQPAPDQNGELFWTEEIKFDLPTAVNKYVLEVKQADGRVKVFDKAGASDWFVVEYDPNGKVLVLKPRSILTAFN